jgi:hypothetical protein
LIQILEAVTSWQLTGRIMNFKTWTQNQLVLLGHAGFGFAMLEEKILLPKTEWVISWLVYGSKSSNLTESL